MKLILRHVLQQFGYLLAEEGETPIVVKAMGNAEETEGTEYKLSPHNQRTEHYGTEWLAREIEQKVACGCDNCKQSLQRLNELIPRPSNRRYINLGKD